MSDIKPIETIYNGYRFRSRLEARWAVFFDALGVEYEYEPEGFDLGDGLYYLPDFRIKCWGTRGGINDEPFDLWIEVKGEMTPQDAAKIIKFSNFPKCESCEHKYAIDERLKINDLDAIWNHCTECYNNINSILIVGNIPKHGYSFESFEVKAYERDHGIYPFNYELIDGDCFAAYPAAHNGKFYLWGDDSHYINWEDEDDVERAYDTARQARFEHGEKPFIK